MDCSKLRITESIINEYQLARRIGEEWRRFARALSYTEADIYEIQTKRGNSNEECCIGVLVQWMHREARDATVEKLAKILIKIELNSVAEILMGLLSLGKEDELAGPEDSNKIERRISEIEINCRHLKEECYQLRALKLELEKELEGVRKEHQDVYQECLKLRTRNAELEGELPVVKQQLQHYIQEARKLHARNLELDEELASVKQDISRQNLETFVVASKEEVSDDTRDYHEPDQANRERKITVQLQELNELLYTSVTSPLKVPEVKEDKLKTSVKLDLLKRLSENLQELYSTVLSMVAETCKCNEEVKREFYDIAYHGIRAEHNDLLHRVDDLRSFEQEMSDEEKEEFKKLQQFQTNRQRQVDRLEKLWRGLFTPPESLPEKSCSETSGASGKSNDCKKKLRRTDPGVKQKQIKSGKQTTNSDPSTRDDDNFEVCFTKFKRTTMKSIFRRKESKEDSCYPVSYSQRTHRDS